MKAIQDNNWLYNVLSPLVQFGTRCHYQTFDVHGIENLPKEGSYIIAPCHQQALMEPLAVLNFAPKPPVFLARADIFAKPVIRAILTFFKILPVYRQRDGQRNLDKNNAIFDLSRRLERNIPSISSRVQRICSCSFSGKYQLLLSPAW